MKEYWINVYIYYIMGFRYYSKKEIDDATITMTSKPLYRIHVRLKC